MAWQEYNMKRFLPILSLLAFAAPFPASANDSSSAVGVGGLELIRNDVISMDSEELYLSADRVRVKYRFTNHSAQDVETLVSFPLPAVPTGISGYMGDRGYPDWTADLAFETKIDGVQAELKVQQIVSVIGDPGQRDIAARLKELGWPVTHWTFENYQILRKALADLNDADKRTFIAEGLLKAGIGDGAVVPNWQVSTHVTRTQIFPAGKTVQVEHSYKPYMGSSIGGGLLKKFRNESKKGFREYAAHYCIDKAFLKSFDRKMREQDRAAKKTGNSGMFAELWLRYILSSGANWRGPIGDFRLVIDMEKPDYLVSICMDGIKQISPTQFEVRKTNFEPTGDIDVLFVPIFTMDAG
jgi:Domain of unknown function (DUF4424)